jgi:hypothetical protein
MDRVQVKDRVYFVREGKQLYGRVAAFSEVPGKVRVTTHKDDEGTWHDVDAVIVSHRYVPVAPPVERVELLPPQQSTRRYRFQ